MEWLKLLENHALLPILCLAILVGLYRLGKILLVEIVKPHVATLVSKHIDVLDAIERNQIQMGTGIAKMGDALSQVAKNLADQSATVGELRLLVMKFVTGEITDARKNE